MGVAYKTFCSITWKIQRINFSLPQATFSCCEENSGRPLPLAACKMWRNNSLRQCTSDHYNSKSILNDDETIMKNTTCYWQIRHGTLVNQDYQPRISIWTMVGNDSCRPRWQCPSQQTDQHLPAQAIAITKMMFNTNMPTIMPTRINWWSGSSSCFLHKERMQYTYWSSKFHMLGSNLKTVIVSCLCQQYY
jgi:hypothetical protein